MNSYCFANYNFLSRDWAVGPIRRQVQQTPQPRKQMRKELAVNRSANVFLLPLPEPALAQPGQAPQKGGWVMRVRTGLPATNLGSRCTDALSA